VQQAAVPAVSVSAEGKAPPFLANRSHMLCARFLSVQIAEYSRTGCRKRRANMAQNPNA